MTVARTVADVLTQHVTFEVECIDRMFLNVYQPRLQSAAGLVGYVQRQLGLPIASTRRWPQTATGSSGRCIGWRRPRALSGSISPRVNARTT